MLLDKLIEKDFFPDGEVYLLSIDNVVEAFWRDNADKADLRMSFPQVASPFPSMFLEYGLPGNDMVRESLTRLYSPLEVQRVGHAVHSYPYVIPEEREPAQTLRLAHRIARIFSGLPREGSQILQNIDKEPGWSPDQMAKMRIEDSYLKEQGAKWECFSHFYAHLWDKKEQRGGVLREAVCLHYYVRADGGMCWLDPSDQKTPMISGEFEPNSFKKKDIPQQQAHVDIMAGLFMPCLMAICFMHCKNVIVKEVSRSERKQSERVRLHKPPLTKFHILNVFPVKVLHDSSVYESGKEGRDLPLHICRGHFKHYEEGKGLFGRLHGTYWWPMHVKGTEQAGVSLKDYNVVAEATRAANSLS
jgi:hypothetical protein